MKKLLGILALWLFVACNHGTEVFIVQEAKVSGQPGMSHYKVWGLYKGGEYPDQDFWFLDSSGKFSPGDTLKFIK